MPERWAIADPRGRMKQQLTAADRTILVDFAPANVEHRKTEPSMSQRGLSEEQRLMRQSCRDFVDEVVTPFIRSNWQREWDMNPQARLPPEILKRADEIGIRTLAVPEEFGGVELERNAEVRTFALIAEEIARGDSGLADKLVQNWKVSVLLRQFAPKHLQEKWFKRLVSE